MLADYFTKPLQGSLFRLFRSVIIGWKNASELANSATETSNDPTDKRTGVKECVEDMTHARVVDKNKVLRVRVKEHDGGDESITRVGKFLGTRKTYADVVAGK